MFTPSLFPSPADLWFLPLGGTGEIGMNMNLYGHADQWLMVDCGVTFHEPLKPEFAAVEHDVVCADPQFITRQREQLAGLIITHAHEDHIGAVEDLWPRLRCPIYTTRFTAAVLRRKLSYTDFADRVEIIEVETGQTHTIGPFKVTWLELTHSIPEPHALLIETAAASVLHTGDWKIDPHPVLGRPFNPKPLQQLADLSIDALVGDSTNALKAGHSVSEQAVYEGLYEAVKAAPKRVVVGCFSSNIARLITLAKVAEATGRHLALFGRSLQNMVNAARSVGLWPEAIQLTRPEHIGYLPANEVLVVATGSQGEPRAALHRLAEDSHPLLALDPDDFIVFSSMIIPGNEDEIAALVQRFHQRGIKTLQAHQSATPIHASGHPCKDELKALYNWVKPRIAIPTHGEPEHLEAHAKLARQQGVPFALVGRNGDLFRIAPQPSIKRQQVYTGRIALREGDSS